MVRVVNGQLVYDTPESAPVDVHHSDMPPASTSSDIGPLAVLKRPVPALGPSARMYHIFIVGFLFSLIFGSTGLLVFAVLFTFMVVYAKDVTNPNQQSCSHSHGSGQAS
jgi:hypothetical protein